MIFRWLTFFSAVSLAAAATVSGSVELTDSRAKGRRNFSGVIVWLEPVGGGPAPAPVQAILDQKSKRFTPHVLPVPVGSTVHFPNHDPIFHNAFSNFAGQPFDTGLYAPGTSQKVTFRRPGVARVFCNIHANMSAVIVVVPSSYYAVSGANGAWRIANVPPGEYLLRVFHERASTETLRALESRLTVADAAPPAIALRISGSGYLEVPHLNKHGGEYPARPQESGLYTGVQ